MWLYQTAAGHYSYFSEHESNTIFIILNIYSIFKAKTSGISDADMSVLTAVNVIRYDTIRYFNVRSKADISQLNLPHGTDN